MIRSSPSRSGHGRRGEGRGQGRGWRERDQEARSGGGGAPPGVAGPPGGMAAAGGVAGYRGTMAKVQAGASRTRPARQKDYAEWWAEVGQNGPCPNCKQPMRVSRSGQGVAVCPVPRCSFRTHADRVRSMAAPEPPKSPARDYFRWKDNKLKKAQAQKVDEQLRGAAQPAGHQSAGGGHQ